MEVNRRFRMNTTVNISEHSYTQTSHSKLVRALLAISSVEQGYIYPPNLIMGSLGASKLDYEVAVIGAGFSGIYELHKLKDAGFNARLYEAGSAVGGIWYWNCYPGARVDTPVPTYQLTDDESWLDWNWKQRFPDYAELRSYFAHLVKGILTCTRPTGPLQRASPAMLSSQLDLDLSPIYQP